MGSFNSFYTPAAEATKEILSRTRFATLQRIGELTSTANSTESFWTGVIEGLALNENDCPFGELVSTSSSSRIE